MCDKNRGKFFYQQFPYLLLTVPQPVCAALDPFRVNFEDAVCCLQFPALFMCVRRRACECQHQSYFSNRDVSRDIFDSAALHFGAHTLLLVAAKAALQHPAVLCLKQFCIELSREGHGQVVVFLLF